MSHPSESQGLLTRVNSSGSNSSTTSAQTTPKIVGLSPTQHAIKLEDHRPGRATTFSLLVSTNEGKQHAGYDSMGSNGLIRSHSLPTGFQGSGVSINQHASVGTTTATGESSPISPYQFGDGTIGYKILFPTVEEESSAEVMNGVEWHVSVAIWLSLAINILLFVSKTFSAIASRSLSVAASAVDSFLDLASQAIVYFAERGSKDHDASLYPAGRSRLEPVGIILCAALMGMAALQLILESGTQLYEGYSHNHHAHVSFDTFSLSLLAFTVIAKLGLWIYCAAYAKYSPTLYTLAVDHRNDVLSNIVALIAAVLAWRWNSAWSADPIGAILMSIYICLNWFNIGHEQIEMIVGRAADPEFIEEIRALSAKFHQQLVPDIIRAYHFGAKYLVELEVILPAEMTVREAHDISLALQQSIEQLPAVERAFVHVDYQLRDIDEHDARKIAEISRTSSKPHSPTDDNSNGQLP